MESLANETIVALREMLNASVFLPPVDRQRKAEKVGMNTRADYDQKTSSRACMMVETGAALHRDTPELERLRREAALDETIEQSFPASDPPSTDPNPDSDTEKYAEERERGD